MGLMMRRRRVRRRRAVLVAGAAGTAAYHAGTRRGASTGDTPANPDESAYPADQPVPPAPPPPTPSAAPSGSISQLQSLASLHEQGALSDDEFAAAKARVLGTDQPVSGDAGSTA